ncbi:hypothetical protein IFM89_012614 [Coptis chinensis]|uniref:Cytochrome P450 n=1 Tax=Coptis chinensis TaxID=261450 RepID=A0A835M8L8_9MAGN|nr:hypothetical protein IFM89_012614 [Coptis chinensis]
MQYPQLHQWLPTSIIALAPIVFSFIVIVLICIVKKRTGNVSKTRKAPEQGRTHVGHLNLVSGPKLLHFVLGELTDKYGPAFTIHLGMYPTLVVSNWELVKECFTTNDKIFSNRPVNKAIKYMFYNEESIGFTPYGSYWRELLPYLGWLDRLWWTDRAMKQRPRNWIRPLESRVEEHRQRRVSISGRIEKYIKHNERGGGEGFHRHYIVYYGGEPITG